jgi:hypothetical protein
LKNPAISDQRLANSLLHSAFALHVLGLAAVLASVIVIGCAWHKPQKLAQTYSAQWHCEIDSVNAQTGKPTEMRCTDPDGTKFKVRAAE